MEVWELAIGEEGSQSKPILRPPQENFDIGGTERGSVRQKKKKNMRHS